ncbi:MAG: hypothetical protein GX604_07680 [Actinobacteria bacterium]|nr:hypothetical protein [Actinomycetota bacterium]
MSGAEIARQDRIRELARQALTEGKVDYFIGWKAGHVPSEVIPAFVRNVDECDMLLWNPLCHHNLTTFLKRKMPDPPDARIGVCVKGCDSRTLVALLQETLVDKERLYVVGVPCDGIIDRRRLEKAFSDEVIDIAFQGEQVVVTTRGGETKELAYEELLLEQCASCDFPNPRYYDDLAGELLPQPEGPPRFPGLEEYEALSAEEKDRVLADAFATCIRCFACIHVCPVCYCWDQCVNRSRRPALVGQKVAAKENLMFQMVHMFHVAGRCPSCGACDRSCPVEIPLYLLHRKMNKELFEMLGFQAGLNVEDKPVFQTFNIDDALGEQ